MNAVPDANRNRNEQTKEDVLLPSHNQHLREDAPDSTGFADMRLTRLDSLSEDAGQFLSFWKLGDEARGQVPSFPTRHFL